ncbi:MAG: FAD-dependent oxidoreductase [Nannocystaceae bacterium]
MSLHVDLAVVGSGPGGTSAAIQAAQLGKRVVLIERTRKLGGTHVHHGAIPRKLLRELALELRDVRAHFGALEVTMDPGHALAYLRERVATVVQRNEDKVAAQLDEVGVRRIHGHARFISPHEICIVHPDAAVQQLRADVTVLAAGSRPQTPSSFELDHEHVLDRDSILSLAHLPSALAIIGAGVTGSEYACIFATLGVEVTLFDKNVLPLSRLESEIGERFLELFKDLGLEQAQKKSEYCEFT